MAKKESVSFSTKLGGNKAIVLGVVMVLLVLFTVETYVVPALGGGGSRAEEYVRYTVGGKQIVLSAERLQGGLGEWQQFHNGQSLVTGRARSGGMEEYLQDLMTASLARDAGLSIPDDTVREFIRTHPLFQDRSGDFDPTVLAESLKRFYGDLGQRSFEEQARRYLLVDHYMKIYANSFLAVSEAECWQRWKAGHPKVEVACAWIPVADVRAGLKDEDVKDEDVNLYWKDLAVQNRHKTPDRRSFHAVAVRIEDCDDAAFSQAREEWKDDADLRLEEKEAEVFWSQWKAYDFNLENLTEDQVRTLRAQNEPRVKAELEEARRRSDAEKERKKAAGEVEEEEEATAPVDPYSVPPLELGAVDQFNLYWKFRIEKELWLQKLAGRIRAAMQDEKLTAQAAMEKFDRPGLGFRVFLQDEPLDQYQVEKVEGLGLPNCPLRYALNQWKDEGKVGSVHGEVLQRTASTPLLEERGWVVFRFTGIVPSKVPALEDVRAEVVKELLDKNARDEGRSRLSRLRRTAEDTRASLEDAAKAEGIRVDLAGPFNEFSWRPPLARDALKDDAARAEAWKDERTRLSAIMSRYFTYRDVPVGAFSEVIDDVDGSGALYLVQVKSRVEPVFEEMTQAAIASERRAIARERLQGMAREMAYDGLKDKLSLFIDGKPAPAATDLGKGR